MNSRFYIFLRSLWVLVLMLTLVACQDSIPQRANISKDKVTTDDPNACPDGEVATDKKDANGKVICEAVPVVRPTGAINFKMDFCTCKDGKPVSYGNCSTFCVGKSANVETFFANFTTNEAISLSGLGNVFHWCTQLLKGGATENPKCMLEVRTEAGKKLIDVTPLPGTNSITSNFSAEVPYDQTVVLTLVESISGARSDSVQMVKFSQDISLPLLGPLKNAPVSQYTCMVRPNNETDSTTGDIFFNVAYRTHWYFLPRQPPAIVPAGSTDTICHDMYNPLYGVDDDELYPRLEQIPGAFNLWDNTDPRFYDNNGDVDKQMDINEIILQKTRNFGGTLPAKTNFFTVFNYRLSPLEANPVALGFYMAPWINTSTFKSYCLTSTEYNSTNALFKALRDIIGVDTEGLYAGQKAPETVPATSGGTTQTEVDTILLRETDLKKVWFYLNNGVPTAPTDANVANVAVFFYYPLNYTSPYVRSSTQKLYRVKSAAEMNPATATGSNATGAPTSYPPHDRKLGCIPKF